MFKPPRTALPRTLALALTLSLAASPLGAADNKDASGTQPKVAPLLMYALTTLGKVVLEEAVDQGLFSRLFGSVFGSGDKKPAASQSAVPATTAAALPNNAQLAAAAGVQTNAVIPAVAYTIEQLDPASFAVIKSHRVDDQIPTMKTGDVFALHYSTNLPGLVRLENIDATGLVTNLGVYTVLPDQNNRIPSNRGIALTGAPGNEIVKILFYPCIPRELGGKPAETALRGRIPYCDTQASTQIDAAAKGSIRTKALINLAQPDPTIAFSGTNDYQSRDVTSTTLVLRHNKP